MLHQHPPVNDDPNTTLLLARRINSIRQAMDNFCRRIEAAMDDSLMGAAERRRRSRMAAGANDNDEYVAAAAVVSESPSDPTLANLQLDLLSANNRRQWMELYEAAAVNANCGGIDGSRNSPPPPHASRGNTTSTTLLVQAIAKARRAVEKENALLTASLTAIERIPTTTVSTAATMAAVPANDPIVDPLTNPSVVDNIFTIVDHNKHLQLLYSAYGIDDIEGNVVSGSTTNMGGGSGGGGRLLGASSVSQPSSPTSPKGGGSNGAFFGRSMSPYGSIADDFDYNNNLRSASPASSVYYGDAAYSRTASPPAPPRGHTTTTNSNLRPILFNPCKVVKSVGIQTIPTHLVPIDVCDPPMMDLYDCVAWVKEVVTKGVPRRVGDGAVGGDRTYKILMPVGGNNPPPLITAATTDAYTATNTARGATTIVNDEYIRPPYTPPEWDGHVYDHADGDHSGLADWHEAVVGGDVVAASMRGGGGGGGRGNAAEGDGSSDEGDDSGQITERVVSRRLGGQKGTSTSKASSAVATPMPSPHLAHPTPLSGSLRAACEGADAFRAMARAMAKPLDGRRLHDTEPASLRQAILTECDPYSPNKPRLVLSMTHIINNAYAMGTIVVRDRDLMIFREGAENRKMTRIPFRAIASIKLGCLPQAADKTAPPPLGGAHVAPAATQFFLMSKIQFSDTYRQFYRTVVIHSLDIGDAAFDNPNLTPQQQRTAAMSVNNPPPITIIFDTETDYIRFVNVIDMVLGGQHHGGPGGGGGGAGGAGGVGSNPNTLHGWGGLYRSPLAESSSPPFHYQQAMAMLPTAAPQRQHPTHGASSTMLLQPQHCFAPTAGIDVPPPLNRLGMDVLTVVGRPHVPSVYTSSGGEEGGSGVGGGGGGGGVNAGRGGAGRQLGWAKKAHFSEIDVYPTHEPLTVVETEFCAANHVPPRTFAEIKARLFNDPTITWVSPLDVAVLCTPPNSRCLNLRLARLIVELLTSQNRLEPMCVIETLPANVLIARGAAE